MRELPFSATGARPLDVARECAARAGALIRDGYGHAGISAVKGKGNVVTEVDLAVERAVMEVLQREYPRHAILSEETASTTQSDGWMWVVDPVDGTKNFAQGIPHFCFSIALCFDSRPQVALTLHPLLDQEFTAIQDEGAWINGEPMRVSERRTVAESVISLDMGYDYERARRQLELAMRIWPGMQALRVYGSAALGFAFVAAGHWDAYGHSNLAPWDCAAGILLVQEAGGVCSDRDGGPATIRSEGVIAGTPGVHDELVRLAAEVPWRA